MTFEKSGFFAVHIDLLLDSIWNQRGHSLLRSLVRLLIRWLRTDRFARALRCAELIGSLASSLTPELMEKIFIPMNWMRRFRIVSTHSAAIFKSEAEQKQNQNEVSSEID